MKKKEKGGAQLAPLEQLSKELKTIEDICGLMEWDMQTQMPPRGGKPRAEQQALMQSLLHRKICSPEMGRALKPFVGKGKEHVLNGLGVRDQALVREMRRKYTKERKVPDALVEEMARLDAQSFQAWAKAKEKGAFSAFAPYLVRQVDTRRRLAECMGYKKSPYDALLDLFEPGATADWIEEVFSALKAWLIPYVKKIAGRPRPRAVRVLTRAYDPDLQWRFGLMVLERMGFDLKAGRQDKSVHPFTASCGGVDDVRITTRINPRDLRPALFGSVHEGGHALYEQGFGRQVEHSVLGSGASCGIHESQSLLWENIVSHSRPFWKYWYPRLKRLFPEPLKKVSLPEFYAAVNEVRPSLIRVEADEVTYALHIIMRFELERDLIEGSIKARSLPRLWNRKMKDYLGIEPPNHTLGVLQDVHWSCGYFGYFPSYALGNLGAAQFYAAARKAIPNLDECMARGDFSTLLAWLRGKIHRHGRIYSAQELVKRVTRKPLSPDAFIRYAEAKYHSLYKV